MCRLGRSQRLAITPHLPLPLIPSPPDARASGHLWHFCPHPACRYHGWVRRGNIRAKGIRVVNHGAVAVHVCRTYFLETHGTNTLHGKHVPAERLVWAVGALAEGLGIRAVARVFEMDPNTVLQWLGEAAIIPQPFPGIPAMTYTSARYSSMSLCPAHCGQGRWGQRC